ncbi:MAG: hypothetical protein M0C28_35640 [Candidatus Moduliflexus flocculans]|nr:hypothetical protein [Candidatus Moduliflexus flocculans]
MSTVSGALNSIATLFTPRHLQALAPAGLGEAPDPRRPPRHLRRHGRGHPLVPMVGHFQSLFQGITAVICYIAPPITAVFLWGVLWRKASATAARVTLMVGSALGLAVFVLDWFKETTGWAVPSMMATFYLFLVCSADPGRRLAPPARMSIRPRARSSCGRDLSKR